MTIQFCLMVLATLLAGAYLARGMFKSSCASGCGSCKSKQCPAKKLEAVRVKSGPK